MNISILINKIIKYKFIIAATLILAFVLGLALGLLLNDEEYRTVAEINVNKVSLNLSRTFEENYYYLFFRYFLNPNNFSSDITIDYFGADYVHMRAYEKITEKGYDISYDDFIGGIEVDKRDSDTNYRMVTVYSDKSLTLDAMEVLLSEVQSAFNDDITGRITSEIVHRLEKGEWLLERIGLLTDGIAGKTTEIEKSESEDERKILLWHLALAETELNSLKAQYKSNLNHIGRLQQVEDFPFWELYEKETRYVEQGAKVRQNAAGIGLTAVVFVSLIWLIGFYTAYIVSSSRRKNG